MVGDYTCQHIDGRGWGRGAPISLGRGYSLYMQAPRIRLRAPETTARESDQQDLKLDERYPCSPSKHAGFRIVQFHDDITKEVPSFTKIVASRTARAATATESCHGARAGLVDASLFLLSTFNLVLNIALNIFTAFKPRENIKLLTRFKANFKATQTMKKPNQQR